MVFFEQTLVEELLLDLANLEGLHATAVGGKFLGTLFAEGGELGLRSCGD